MRILCDERPKDSSECILQDIVLENVAEEIEYTIKCDGNCKECKYITTLQEISIDQALKQINEGGYDSYMRKMIAKQFSQNLEVSK